MLKKIATIAAVAVAPAMACLSGSCSQNMCSDIPANDVYYLTSFCDAEVACGSFSGDCNEYFMADYKRFGCNSIVSCCQGSDCLNLKVIDGGPSCEVEDNAGKQVVDASYSTCKHFTGSTSCGWSDHISVTCKKTSYVVEDTLSLMGYKDKIPLGPCSYNATFATETSVPMCGGDLDLF